MIFTIIITLSVGFQQLLHTALQKIPQQRRQQHTFAQQALRQISLPFFKFSDR